MKKLLREQTDTGFITIGIVWSVSLIAGLLTFHPVMDSTQLLKFHTFFGMIWSLLIGLVFILGTTIFILSSAMLIAIIAVELFWRLQLCKNKD